MSAPSTRRSVLLPAPFSPDRWASSPGASARSTESSARSAPYSLVTPRASSALTARFRRPAQKRSPAAGTRPQLHGFARRQRAALAARRAEPLARERRQRLAAQVGAQPLAVLDRQLAGLEVVLQVVERRGERRLGGALGLDVARRRAARERLAHDRRDHEEEQRARRRARRAPRPAPAGTAAPAAAAGRAPAGSSPRARRSR